MRPQRAAWAAGLLAAAVIACAGLLQWWWAGWSAYAGAGPPLGTRWLLTSAVGATLLLPPCAAMWGAATARRFADSGLLDQLRITRWSAGRLTWFIGAQALALPLLALLASGIGWALVAELAPAALFRSSAAASGPDLLAIGMAHGIAAVIAAAFALWGAALAVGRRTSRIGQWGEWRRLGLWGPAVQTALNLGPWLVGPLLPHLRGPEIALDAVLLVNPITVVGASLGMDILRSPRVYDLTRAPEYWYTYPPPLAVVAVYLTLAALGGYRLRKAVE